MPPSARHLPRARSIALPPPPYSQEVQTPDFKTVGERKECPRRAEVLEGSPQSSAVRKPVLARSKLPCQHVSLLWAAVQIPGLEESPMMPQEAFQTSSLIHLLLPGDAGGPNTKMNEVTESSTVDLNGRFLVHSTPPRELPEPAQRRVGREATATLRCGMVPGFTSRPRGGAWLASLPQVGYK